MESVEEFINSMVKIEFIEDSNCFGHYPFQLFVETNDGKYELNSLALGGNVSACYNRFVNYKNNGANRIYLSLDFPKGGDIQNDFVVILSFENNEIKLQAITYQVNDGEILEVINDSQHLKNIMTEFMRFI